MSSDWTVISRHEQTHRILIAALLEAMPESSLRTTSEETLLEVVDDEPAAVLAVELPRLIHNDLEPRRLLAGADISAVEGVPVPPMFTGPNGTGHSGEPIWWQEIHALGIARDTDPLADRLAHAIAARSDGVVLMPQQEGR